MKTQKIYVGGYSALLCAILSMGGCNGGSTASGAGARAVLAKSTVKVANAASLRQAVVTNGNVMHLYQSDLYKNVIRDDHGDKQSVLPSTIGWDSVNNRPAPLNCWTFTEQATNSSTNGDVGVAYSAQYAKNALNISSSVSTQFLIFSASSGFNFSSLAQSSTQAVNAYALASGNATMQFQITGLQPFAKQLYDTNPDEFTQECGDQVVTKLPVKNQIIAGVNFYTNSNAFNQSENAKLSGSFLMTTVAADVATQNSSASTSTTTNVNWVTLGQYDTNLFNQAQYSLQLCLTNNGNDGSCATAFTTLSQAATTAFTNNVNTVNAAPGQPLWANYFVVDYFNTDDFTFISDKLALMQAGIHHPVATNPDFEPYKTAIQHNMDVLQDLQIASNMLQNNIGPEFKQYLITVNPSNYLIDASDLAEVYTNGLTRVVSAVSEQLQNCLASTAESSVTSNCSVLNPNQTVNNAISTYFRTPYSSAVNASLASSMVASVIGLIYDSVNSGFKYMIIDTPFLHIYTPTMNPFIGYTIWVPNSSGGADVITLPNAKGSPISIFNIPQSEGATSGVYAIFDNPSSANYQFYPSTSNSATKLYVGVAGQSQTVGGLNVQSSSSSVVPAYQGQICNLFANGSAGCTYNYMSDMGVYINAERQKVKPSSTDSFSEYDTISVTDNYQIGQASLFKTLYPWAPDNR